MRIRQDVLAEIRDKYITTHDKSTELFLLSMWTYYLRIDLETGNNFAAVFKELYMSEEKHSFDEVSYKYSIGLSTLERYRSRFNKLAMRMLLLEEPSRAE